MGLPRTHGSLRIWGEKLKAENNSLGYSLIEYADAWQAQICEMQKEISDAARDATSEAGWRHSQGDEYGSY